MDWDGHGGYGALTPGQMTPWLRPLVPMVETKLFVGICVGNRIMPWVSPVGSGQSPPLEARRKQYCGWWWRRLHTARRIVQPNSISSLNPMLHTVDGFLNSITHHEMKPWEAKLFVGIYVGETNHSMGFAGGAGLALEIRCPPQMPNTGFSPIVSQVVRNGFRNHPQYEPLATKETTKPFLFYISTLYKVIVLLKGPERQVPCQLRVL